MYTTVPTRDSEARWQLATWLKARSKNIIFQYPYFAFKDLMMPSSDTTDSHRSQARVFRLEN